MSGQQLSLGDEPGACAARHFDKSRSRSFDTYRSRPYYRRRVFLPYTRKGHVFDYRATWRHTVGLFCVDHRPEPVGTRSVTVVSVLHAIVRDAPAQKKALKPKLRPIRTGRLYGPWRFKKACFPCVQNVLNLSCLPVEKGFKREVLPGNYEYLLLLSCARCLLFLKY